MTVTIYSIRFGTKLLIANTSHTTNNTSFGLTGDIWKTHFKQCLFLHHRVSRFATQHQSKTFINIPSSASPSDFCKACNRCSVCPFSSSMAATARCRLFAFDIASSRSRSASFILWAKSRRAERTVSGSISPDISIDLIGDIFLLGDRERSPESTVSSMVFSGERDRLLPNIRRRGLGLRARVGDGVLKVTKNMSKKHD